MDNYSKVQKSFSIQAEKFASYHMSNAEYTDYLIDKIGARGDEKVLEVAAGTCVCGRALAPCVREVTCLDLTEAMLEQGERLAARDKIKNISFVRGRAEKLPFDNESFNLVIIRLSLHHFAKPENPFNEMCRVLKKDGKLVVWDMVATTEELREINDRIELMRDSSHIRKLSKLELEKLFESKFALLTEEVTYVPVKLQSWMELTDTPENVQRDIVRRMTEDLGGGAKTGFYPYVKEGEIYFDHRWQLLIGIKL